MHVINLVLTVRIVTHAYKYVQTASQEGKQILFIGTKRQAANTIAEEAKKCGASFIAHRWLGGTLTNWPTIRGRVKYLKELSKKETSGELELLPKKEAALLRKKREKLLQNLGGLTEMNQVPDIAIVVDPKRESTAIAECKKLGIAIFIMPLGPCTFKTLSLKSMFTLSGIIICCFPIFDIIYTKKRYIKLHHQLLILWPRC